MTENAVTASDAPMTVARILENRLAMALDVAHRELAEIKRRARDLCDAIDVSTMVGACDFGTQRVLLERLCDESPMSDAAVEEVVAALKRADVAPTPTNACFCDDLTDKVKRLEADPRMSLDLRVVGEQVRLGAERGIALRAAEKVIAEARAWIAPKNLDEDHHHYDPRAVMFATRCAEALATIRAVTPTSIDNHPNGDGTSSDYVSDPWAPAEKAE